MSKARGLADLGNAYSDGALSNRNLIINGAMQVAQRGTSGSMPTTDNYLLDRHSLSRFGGYPDNATQTQESDAPTGHYKSFKMVRNSAYTLAGTNASAFSQKIEGQNVAHLNWGTSSAQPVTVSFWVKSNKTGDFPFIVADSGNAYDIGKLYNIALANTWEYKTIQIDAPTSGTFDTDNTVGLTLSWGFGAIDAARTAQGTTWGASNSAGSSKTMVTGASTALATDNGATWQITGVQLEVGDTATPFEHRSYSDEIQRCSRYAHVLKPEQAYGRYRASYSDTGTSCNTFYEFPVEMRSLPTLTSNNMSSSTFQCYSETDGGFYNPTSAFTLGESSKRHVYMSCNTATATAGAVGMWRWNNNPSASMVFDAEL